LLKPDDPAAVEALFAGFPVQPLPMQSAEPGAAPNSTAAVPNPLVCDDPKAG